MRPSPVGNVHSRSLHSCGPTQLCPPGGDSASPARLRTISRRLWRFGRWVGDAEDDGSPAKSACYRAATRRSQPIDTQATQALTVGACRGCHSATPDTKPYKGHRHCVSYEWDRSIARMRCCEVIARKSPHRARSPPSPA
jgi:hypothetical protein